MWTCESTSLAPHVGEINIRQSKDTVGECLLYDHCMTRVYLADAKFEERSALRLLLLDLKMIVIGDAADWPTMFAQVPVRRTDILVVDKNLLPEMPVAALQKLRKACPAKLLIVLTSHLNDRQQAALFTGADTFISKVEPPERMAQHLQAVMKGIPLK